MSTHRRYFTLMELLAAVAITAAVVPIALAAIAGAARLDAQARWESQAMELADMKLRELVVTDDWRDGETSGDFGDDYPAFEWELTTEDWSDEYVTMRELAITVRRLDDADGPSVTLRTLASDEEEVVQ